MLQIAICDDEQFYRDKMKNLLERYMQKNALAYVIHTFLSGGRVLKTVRTQHEV